MSLSSLSSNWKLLQQRLAGSSQSKDGAPQTEKLAKSTKRKATALKDENTSSKKRKADTNESPRAAHRKSKPMSKPRAKSLTEEQKPTLEPPSRPSTSLSKHETTHNDVENEGVSPTALAGKFIALDCEMVGVGPTPDQDSQLARVSMVNFHGEQIYDTYVKPKLPVTDYRTAFSGIRPHNLKVGRPFREVQKDVATFLEGRVLVGHHLKSDLQVLSMKHPTRDTRDSAKLQKFKDLNGGRTPKLKLLAKLILGLEIQGGEHNSVEDARAAMMLYKAEKDAFEMDSRRMFPLVAPGFGTSTAGSKKKKKKRR
ncbi:putative exonuclease [Microthyrium microscopicum]|uniref:RNA exonuclease 4 n=1 Tax=Microthyrium microscopicum TaxID=703497 RepID=A0A6A6UJT3_9PEZI|nr:putative exonuclease [Microthyrium microscopicum]